MTVTDDLIDLHPGRQRAALAAVALLTVPAFLAGYAGLDATPAVLALLYGLAIVGAAFAIRGRPRRRSSTSRRGSRSRSSR